MLSQYFITLIVFVSSKSTGYKTTSYLNDPSSFNVWQSFPHTVEMYTTTQAGKDYKYDSRDDCKQS